MFCSWCTQETSFRFKIFWPPKSRGASLDHDSLTYRFAHLWLIATAQCRNQSYIESERFAMEISHFAATGDQRILGCQYIEIAAETTGVALPGQVEGPFGRAQGLAALRQARVECAG